MQFTVPSVGPTLPARQSTHDVAAESTPWVDFPAVHIGHDVAFGFDWKYPEPHAPHVEGDVEIPASEYPALQPMQAFW